MGALYFYVLLKLTKTYMTKQSYRLYLPYLNIYSIINDCRKHIIIIKSKDLLQMILTRIKNLHIFTELFLQIRIIIIFLRFGIYI